MNVFAPGFIAGFAATGEAGTPLCRIGESGTLTLRKGGVITGRVTDAARDCKPARTVFLAETVISVRRDEGVQKSAANVPSVPQSLTRAASVDAKAEFVVRGRAEGQS